jgi:hypothetical protein
VRAHDEALAPFARHRGDRPGPQVLQPRFGGIGWLRRIVGHEQLEPVEVSPGAGQVARVLEVLEEVIVEEEHPDVPVRDRVEHRTVAVRMGIGAHQRVVHRVQRGFVPDQATTWLGRVEHAHLACPRGRVLAGAAEVRIQPRRIRQVKLGKIECLHVVTLARRVTDHNS